VVQSVELILIQNLNRSSNFNRHKSREKAKSFRQDYEVQS
jgi:hypothetical protein